MTNKTEKIDPAAIRARDEKKLSERTKAALQSVLEAYPHDPYGPHSAAAEGCIHCSVLAEVALVLSQEDFDEIDAALAGQPEAGKEQVEAAEEEEAETGARGCSPLVPPDPTPGCPAGGSHAWLLIKSAARCICVNCGATAKAAPAHPSPDAVKGLVDALEAYGNISPWVDMKHVGDVCVGCGSILQDYENEDGAHESGCPVMKARTLTRAALSALKEKP